MKNIRWIVPIVTLLVTAGLSFAFPKAQYHSPDMAAKIVIPQSFGYWKNRDVTDELNLNDQRYNFISRIVAREFRNDLGENFLFMLLDAGNFHHPKVCFGGSGFTVESLEDIAVETPYGTLKAKAIFMEKGRESVLVVYWICINKKVMDWTGQKIEELKYTLFNKEKVGLMGRLDIPVQKPSVPHAVETARSFLRTFSRSLSPEDAVYLFGEKTAP